jgi:hypothetical protein
VSTSQNKKFYKARDRDSNNPKHVAVKEGSNPLREVKMGSSEVLLPRTLLLWEVK